MKRNEFICRNAAAEVELKAQIPDWRERMAAWEEGVAGNQPKWTIVRPEVDDTSTGGRNTFRRRMDRCCAWLCTDQTSAETGRSHRRQTDHGLSTGAADRSEFAARRAGPIDLGHRRADGIRGGSRAGVGSEENSKVKFVSATADVNPPETPLVPIFDDKSGKRRVTGPMAFAIDGDPRPPGASTSIPAAAISRARRCLSPRSRSTTPAARC